MFPTSFHSQLVDPSTGESAGGKLLGYRPHLLERTAAGGLGCRHDGSLHDRRVAHDDQISSLRLQHFDGHLAVRLRAAEADQDRDPFGRPGIVDGVDDQRHVGAEAAVRVSSAERHPDLAADHLPHHVGRPFGDVLRMRHDDDADHVVHCSASRLSQTACTRMQLDRAPGSTCPTLRAPRNEARPLVACIGMVRATASLAVVRTRSIRSGWPASAFKISSTGHSTSSIVFSPGWERPRALTAPTPDPKIPARFSGSFPSRDSASPAAMKKLPKSGPEAPPTVITSVLPTALSASSSGCAPIASSLASTASHPRFMLTP